MPQPNKNIDFFFESKHSVENEYVYYNTEQDLNWERHFHMSFEFIFIETGEMTVFIDGTEFTAHTGQTVLVLPNQLHSLKPVPQTISHVCIVSTDYLPDVAEYYVGQGGPRTYRYPILKTEKELFMRIPELKEERYAMKSLLYGFFARYERGKVFDGFSIQDNDLVLQITGYLEANFSEQIDLTTLSRKYGYNCHYLSALINRCFGCSFPKLLNNIRINAACRMMRDEYLSTTETALRCGFGTIRTFNRNFRKQLGCTPKEYIHKQQKSHSFDME